MAKDYAHTQKSPLWLASALPGLVAAVLVGVADEVELRILFAALAVVFFLLGASFATLTVRHDVDGIAVRFGPLPLFGTRVRYAAIRSARPARSSVFDGWGIHWFPGRGWTFNVWGRDCVEIETDRGCVRIGTNDPQGLAAFLASRTTGRRDSGSWSDAPA